MTKRVALVGMPLRRRHSEVMHNAAFDHYGIDARYELRPTEAEQLPAFFDEVRQPEWLGFQVTAPHKQAAMNMVDEVEPDAMSIGAINTGVRTDDGRLIGLNTDGSGFARSVENDLDFSFSGTKVVISGSGGAARAVAHACLARGADEVVVGNRTASTAIELAQEVGDPRLRGGGFDNLFESALAEADLAVNATTVGMTTSGVPFDVSRLPATARVFDLVYIPAETELVGAARSRGLFAVNGLGMLIAQGAIAFERWTGVVDPDEVMRQSLVELVNDPTAQA
jgi:shikimate dehydrogenase